jgi:hypothetical protein
MKSMTYLCFYQVTKSGASLKPISFLAEEFAKFVHAFIKRAFWDRLWI